MREILSLFFVALCLSPAISAQKKASNPDRIQQIHIDLSGDHTPFTPDTRATVSESKIYSFSADTNWVYEEFKDNPSSAYKPTSYSLYYDTGTPNEFIHFEKQFFMETDTIQWVKQSEKRDYYTNQFLDSTVYYSYTETENPTYAFRIRYSRNPPAGATSESFEEKYTPESGWTKHERKVTYVNNDSTTYWMQQFLYDEPTERYYLFQLTHTELGEHFKLVESKRYNINQIEAWYKRYSHFDDQHRKVYETEFRLNSTKDGLLPTDSVHYTFGDNVNIAEDFVYSNDLGWEPLTFTRTYTSQEGLRTDSTLTYDLVFINGEYLPGDVIAKTRYLYNGNGNLLEQRYYNYNTNPDNPLIDKVTYEYEFINGEYQKTEERHLKWNSSISNFYTSRIESTEFDEDGYSFDHSILILSLNGDTTSFTKSQVIQFGDVEYSIHYEWDPELKKLVRKASRKFSDTLPVIQIALEEPGVGGFRTLEVSGGYPAVFNDGPLFIEIGDTLDIILSALNADLSVPEIQVTNMPATATFNEETQKFYWIVDDLNPAPMTYTVTKGEKSYSTDVLFMHDGLAVENESMAETPVQITLHQNYPNPFNPQTSISFNLTDGEQVSIVIYNMLGQRVAELLNDQPLSAGTHTVHFKASGLSSGVYYYQLSAGSNIITKSMMLIK